MIAIRARLAALRRGDDGFGITEVLFAMLIFTVVSVGIAYSMISTLRLSGDSRSREIAANLAASEIDNARAAGDPFTLYDNVRTVTVDGMIYTITRNTGWVSSTGSSSGCNTGSGSLQYKSVDVQVTWPTKLSTTSPVRTNTLLAPITRINDPSYGTILVRVTSPVPGKPMPGVPITMTASGGGIAVAMADTDVEGCSYAFKVAPGNYTITLNKLGYISADQKVAPSISGTIVAGSTFTPAFQYDQAGTFNVTYASNASSPSSLNFPSNLDTTYISTFGVYTTVGSPASLSLHPFVAGYSVFSGSYVAPAVAPATPNAGCISPDPASWQEGTVGTTLYAAGVRRPNVAASPGGTVLLGIPMGVVSFTYTGAKDRYFTATSTTGAAATGDPGCSTPKVYKFSAKNNVNTPYRLALPYGTWQIATVPNVDGSGAAVAVIDPLSGNVTGTPSITTITLDPRVAK